MATHNTYQLMIHIREPVVVKVGALGILRFPAGYYVYTGSAKKNMQARLKRHCQKQKPLRWHIDYLTTLPASSVIKTKKFRTEECRLNQATEGRIIAPGFGASDCKAGCNSHLKYLGTQQSWAEL